MVLTTSTTLLEKDDRGDEAGQNLLRCVIYFNLATRKVIH